MKKVRRITNERGVTLMEVMIAMIILSVALLMLLNMAMVAVDGNDWSNRTTTATQLLQDKLEQLRVQAGGPTSGNDMIDGVTRTWEVSDGGDFLWQVEIKVNWSDVRNHDHEDKLIAFIKSDSL